MLQLFTNTKSRQDDLLSEIKKLGKNATIDIAVAFFTYSELIKCLIDNGCNIRLIVRLDWPTQAQSLREVLRMTQQVSIRYYTAKEFHPKLYIFKDKCAIVGSSNLTPNGLNTNQEINVSISAKSPIFRELEELFRRYWEEAKPLTEETVEIYSQLMLDKHNEDTKEINDKLGLVKFNDIVLSTGDKLFLNDVNTRLRGEAPIVAEQLLKSVRSWYKGQLSYRAPSKYYEEYPKNFWTAHIQPRKNGLQITISGKPEIYHSNVFDLELTFRVYTKFFLSRRDQIPEAVRLIKKSAQRKGVNIDL
jgi:HKD family nuclease